MIDQDTTRRSDSGGGSYPDDLDRVDHLLEWLPPAHWTDLRGYQLVGPDESRIGTIRYLVVSPGTQRLYFVIVDTGNWFQHQLYAVPVDILRLNPAERTAFGSFSMAEFAQAPQYQEGDRNFTPSGTYWEGITEKQSRVAQEA